MARAAHLHGHLRITALPVLAVNALNGDQHDSHMQLFQMFNTDRAKLADSLSDNEVAHSL